MKLEINEIYHNYITRVVIFALFLYKSDIRKENVYKALVISYLKKRVFWEINLKIDTGIRLEKDEERDVIFRSLLYNVETDYLTTVTVTFKTPLKTTTMEINLRDEEKYSNFLYN